MNTEIDLSKLLDDAEHEFGQGNEKIAVSYEELVFDEVSRRWDDELGEEEGVQRRTDRRRRMDHLLIRSSKVRC